MPPKFDPDPPSGRTESNPDNSKRKEIYTYDAQWDTYSLGWSARCTHPFRLAVGSFIQEYSNKVEIIQLNEVEFATWHEPSQQVVWL